MNYEEIVCDANNLYRAYKASVKNSKWKETSQKFAMNFLKYIFSIQEDLVYRTLQNGLVDEFLLSERGRVRPITSIQIKDRIIRHVLCDEILSPEVKKRIIYDNGASVKGRGISHQRNRFEVHLHKYYRLYSNEGWILFGDFSKFYDNIVHEIAKRELLKLVDNDEFLDWLLTIIFNGFKIDVSYMSDEEYESCITDTFNKLEYRLIPKELLTGEKWMDKSVNIGDQLSQIDNYVKYVRSQKFYGRYMDDWYIMNPNKKELQDLLVNIRVIADELGIHINEKKTHIVKISSTYKYLQVKYTLTKDGKVIKRINPTRVTAMHRKLKKLAVKVKVSDICYENVENMFRGWMGSFYKLLSRQQRNSLIQLYEDLFDKNVTVVNKKLVILDRSDKEG
jgi:Reverse transcriptase (RNA-dependent DNA polymerase).